VSSSASYFFRLPMVFPAFDNIALMALDQPGLVRRATKSSLSITASEMRHSHPTTCLIDDMVAAVDVKCLPGDKARRIVRQESGRNADVIDANKAERRGLLLCLLKHLIEFRNSGCRAS